MNRPISPALYSALIEALKRLRVAKHAGDEVGVSGHYAWRVAKKEGIELVSLAEHQRKRLADPNFRAKQAPAARKGASLWLKAKHANPKFHKKSV
jgi:CRISPR/Cas system-associated protein Csm6